MPERPAAPDVARAVLPRDLAVFLPLFAIALHKVAAYPEGHPLRAAALDSALARLQLALASRERLMIAVARTQLVVDGLATDPASPIFRDLARKLHRHQVGAIKVVAGVGREEFGEACQFLAADHRTHPAGLTARDRQDQWYSIRFFPPAYDRLELSDSGRPRELGSTAAKLWHGLAVTALADEGVELNLEAGTIAQALNAREPDQAQTRQVIQYLLGLGRELRLSQAAEASALRERLTSLFSQINPETMKRLMAVGGDLLARGQLLREASHALPANAVLTLLRAAGREDGAGQPISDAMLRLLTKLSHHAEHGAPDVQEGADLLLRESVRQLVDRWTLAEPARASYSRVLDRLARHPGAPTLPDGEAGHPSEAFRLVQISLETDTVGDLVWGALEEVVQQGQAGELVSLLADERIAPDIVEKFWGHLATPEIMRILLTNEPRDTPVVEALFERMGIAAAEPMLETLEVADSRTMRRRLLTRLGKLGPAVGPLLVERLKGAPWYVIRNLLALLGSMHSLPPAFDPMQYAEHEDPRVRREAVKLMLRLPAHREAGVIACLGDDDNQNVQLGLSAALERCPPAAVGRLRMLLNDRRLPAELRLLAIKVLGAVRTTATRDWLIEQAVARQTWFRRHRLAPKSPELLVVLSALARHFSEDPRVAPVLRLARESPDPEIRAALAEGA